MVECSKIQLFQWLSASTFQTIKLKKIENFTDLFYIKIHHAS